MIFQHPTYRLQIPVWYKEIHKINKLYFRECDPLFKKIMFQLQSLIKGEK